MVCDQESARTHAHRKSYQCPRSKRLSGRAKRSTEVPSRGLQSHSEERVSTQTHVYVHDSNRAEVILNPEDMRGPQGVFYLCTTSRQDLKAQRESTMWKQKLAMGTARRNKLGDSKKNK